MGRHHKNEGEIHHQNYETNPRSAARKREDAVSFVRFSASKRQKAGLNLLPNEPKDGRAPNLVRRQGWGCEPRTEISHSAVRLLAARRRFYLTRSTKCPHPLLGLSSRLRQTVRPAPL